MKKLNKLGCAIALTLMGSAANAAVVYDTMPGSAAGPSFGSDSIPNGYIADLFNTGSTHCTPGCQLGNVTMKLRSTNLNGFGTLNGYTASIFSDNGGTSLGGTNLGNLNNLNLPNASEAAVTFAPTGTIVLNSNTSYWIRLAMTGATDNGIEWFWPNSAGPLEIFADGSITFSNQTLGHHLKVEVSDLPASVPVPSAFIMMGTALAGLFVRQRKAI